MPNILLSSCSAFLLACSCSAFAGLPHYDHVVIVIEENRSLGQIIGNRVDCPYINTLVDGGVTFNNFYALVHPSQPNYLHIFSGSAQSVTDDNLPAGIPFTTANLGAALLAKGVSFAGYGEGLDVAGNAAYDPHTATHPGVKYRRKHIPWANWVSTVVPLPANQLPPSVHQPFTAFPTNFSTLPAVSFVVPDQDHDMHDGSRKDADTWLQTNLSAYANWCQAHNSLLIVTWDEDDYAGINRIPTVFYGAHLKNGTSNSSSWTLHNLTRTVEDIHAAGHSSRTGQVRSIYGVFDTDQNANVTTLRQGLNGYGASIDTFIHSDLPDDNLGGDSHDLSADGDYGAATGSQPSQSLIRFSSLFGTGVNQIPSNATILSAKLLLSTGTGTTDNSTDRMEIHRMLVTWDETSTWNSLVSGVAYDGTDAVANGTFSVYPDVVNGPAVFDVTADIEAWRAGATNFGWLVRPSSTGTDGWIFKSSEASTDVTKRPTLEITWLSAFQAWANGYSLPVAGALGSADDDGDSLPIVLEYAFGMDPRVANRKLLDATNSPALPMVTTSTAGASKFLSIEFLRRKNAAALGLVYTPQFGNTLADFTAATQPEVVTSIDATWERVKITDSVALTAAVHRFGRVKVTLTP